MPWEQEKKAPDGGAPPWGSLPPQEASPDEPPSPQVGVTVTGATPSSVAVTVKRGAAAAHEAVSTPHPTALHIHAYPITALTLSHTL